ATTREALRYKIALFHGQERMHERAGLIIAGMAKGNCSEIRSTITDLRQVQGTYIGNPLTEYRIYTSPTDTPVFDNKLHNWYVFLNSDTDLDPLMQMAIAHYQFEAIHPFDDGNGRTVRILNVLMLVAK